MSGPGLKVRSPDEQPLWDQYGTNKLDASRMGPSPFAPDAGGSMGGIADIGTDMDALSKVAEHMKAGPEKDHVLTAIARHITTKVGPVDNGPRGMDELVRAAKREDTRAKPMSIADQSAATRDALFAKFGPQGSASQMADQFGPQGQAAPQQITPPPQGVPPLGGVQAPTSQVAGNIEQMNQMIVDQGGNPLSSRAPGWGMPTTGAAGAAGPGIAQQAAQVQAALGAGQGSSRGERLDAQFKDDASFAQNLVDASPAAQEHGGRVRQMIGVREKRRAAEDYAGDVEQHSAEAFDQSMANFGEQRRDTQALLDEQAKQQRFVQDKTEFLASQMTDLMSRKVDPGRLWNHGGQMAALGATISDAINAGVSWLYGKSPNEMGSQMDKVHALIEEDTNRQQEEINSGRANLNAGAQMLAQMQNVYQSQGAAKAALMMQKWQASKDLLTARLQKLTDDKQIAAAKSLIGEADIEMGKLAVAFKDETTAAAARAAAAQRAAEQQKFDNLMKAGHLAVDFQNADTAAGKAALETQGKPGELEGKSVPLSDGTFLMAGTGEQAEKLKAHLEGISDTRRILNEARAIKLSMLDGTIKPEQLPLYQERLASLNKEAVAAKNKAWKLGALDVGVQDLIGTTVKMTEPSTLQAYGTTMSPKGDSAMGTAASVANPGGWLIGKAGRNSLTKDIALIDKDLEGSKDAEEIALRRHGGSRYQMVQGRLLPMGQRGAAPPQASGAPPDFEPQPRP